MSEHDTTTPPSPGVVVFTLPEGTKITAPRALAERLGWKPDEAIARRSKK